MRNLSGVSTIACQRCRLRKTRCDRNLPKCKACERANAPCLTTDPTSGRAVPRSYLSHLEARVKELETELAKRDDSNLDLGHVDGGSYLGASAGLTFSCILSAALKENLPGEQTLQTTPRSRPEQGVDVRLPSKPVAEQYMSVFFREANPQLPILHREAFVRAHFEPVYGRLSPSTHLASDQTSMALDQTLEEPPPGSFYRRCVDTGNFAYPSVATRRSLYFLYSVFAIGVASRQQEYDAKLAESLHLTAMQYYRVVISSPDRLEALQGVLLLGLYSVMRPAYPGIWHVVGTAMRMCQELGLHNERRNTKSETATRDLCRRLFWCAYSLDRQISVYLGRPPGIPDYCVRTPFPSMADDSQVPYRVSSSDESDLPTGTEIVDSARSTSESPLADLTNVGPSYKRISLAFFKLRRIQGQIQAVLYDGSEVPRAFADLGEWREYMFNKLESWWHESQKDTKLNNCHFNSNFLCLNYHQTRILLFGVSPGNLRPSESHMLFLAHAGLQIIQTYSDIFASKSLNYSWAAVHNIFLAGTSYLYVLYHSSSFRSKTSITELETVVISTLEVIDYLSNYCDAAATCHRSFKLLSQAIIELVRRDKVNNNSQSPGVYSERDDSIDSFLQSAAVDGANSRQAPPRFNEYKVASDTGLATPSLQSTSSNTTTPLFQGQVPNVAMASPMQLSDNSLRDSSSSPVQYKGANLGIQLAEQFTGYPPVNTLPTPVAAQHGVPAKVEQRTPASAGRNNARYTYLDDTNGINGAEDDPYVYDFLNEMQQSFIWNNFLNQSSQANVPEQQGSEEPIFY